ncbi:MAG: LOW QUALITY PROTEIN: hypothetical protein BJ554DRAFT_3424 [Olpidium bornovanus]|uniref:Uncharacterized protein n=1 Tax=Olpidium bornovanus TaxID=278681 RepID=A0A8H8DFN2_9FUNG|nr:MAG: LOW QUALITY PROTEIN: hypothetical protein BJ554DRAFT_3424 [Olpidium bornovanus]
MLQDSRRTGVRAEESERESRGLLHLPPLDHSTFYNLGPMPHVPTTCSYLSRHTKRYFSLYLPNAGFEVGQTFRYDPAKAEACLLATKDFAVGEVISLCTGTLAYVSSDQENALTGSQQDFSVMYSSKTRRMGVMTGPARFANVRIFLRTSVVFAVGCS